MKKSDKCYTPFKYIKAIKEVLEEIDFDLASDSFGNSRIKAKYFFSEAKSVFDFQDSINGRIYLNSPYSTGNLFKFNKLLLLPKIEEAISLTPNDTSTLYFKMLANHSRCFCATDHRIQFVDENGNFIGNGADFGNIFWYFGNNESKFVEVFSKFGTILKLY